MRRKIITALLALGTLVAHSQVVVEAESGKMVGTSIATEGAVTYVTGLDADNDQFIDTVTVSTAGLYSVQMKYRCADVKTQYFLVNGETYTSVLFPPSASWGTVTVNSVYLNAGKNTFGIKKYWGMDEFDNFTFTPSTETAPDYTKVTKSLINPNADANAYSLYNFLLQNYGKYTISGQTDSYYDNVTELTKKKPMLRAFDMVPYSNHYPYGWNNATGTHDWRTCTDDGTVQKAIDWYNSTNKQGIVALHWHWPSPTLGTVGTNTFSTANTTFDVRKAVTPGTDEYKATIRDIDSVATYLLKFKKAGIPVLWRPLHEAGGGWFWWGAKGAAPCKALWDTVYNRMVNKYQLNNLIWVWSTPEEDWYPGNDKVDIFGFDSYPGAYQYTAQKAVFEQLRTISKGEKLLTMSENGPIADPNKCVQTDARWSYFMSWAELLLAENSVDHIRDAYIHPNIISLEDYAKLSSTKPSVAFRDPEDNKFYIEGTSITVTAIPFSANSTIDSMTFFVDGVRKFMTQSLPMVSYTFENLPAGKHTITVRAYDKTQQFGDGVLTQTIVAVNDLKITINPDKPSILPGGTIAFSATTTDQTGNPCTGVNLTWSVDNAGGTLSNQTATSAKFTPTATSGSYAITATYKTASSSTTIAIIDCPVTTKPLATNWIATNAWSDQNIGSGPRQTADALILQARQWPKLDLLTVQKGVPLSVVKGNEYLLFFEFKNDQKWPVYTMAATLAKTWGADAVTATTSNTVTINAPTDADYSTIAMKFVATESATAYLSLALLWKVQPNDTSRLLIKNLSICGDFANSAPTLTVTGATNNSYYIEGSAIKLTATPSSIASTIDSVTFFVDGVRMYMSPSASTVSYTFSNLSAGTHTIKVRAYDKKKQFGDTDLTENIVALNDLKIKISPENPSVLSGGSISFTATATDKNNNPCIGLALTWQVNAGETLTNITATSAKFTPAAKTGSFTVTASMGTASVSNTIDIVDCPVTAIPLATNWIITNDWKDQEAGSALVQATDALTIKARQWGKANLLAVQTGVPLQLIKGKEYTVIFDLKNDAANPLTSVGVTFAKTYSLEAVTASAANTVVVNVSAGSAYSTISAKFVATETATTNLSLALVWGAKPNAVSNISIKNVSICGDFASSVDQSNIDKSVFSLHPNPASDKITVSLSAAKITGSIYAVSSNGSRVLLSANGVGEDLFSVSIASLNPGHYTIEIPTSDGLVRKAFVVIR